MDWLKEIITDETLLSQITKELPKHFIPKDQYNKKVDEITTLRGEFDTSRTSLTTLEGQLTTLKEKAELADKYKADFENVNGTIETLKAESQKKIDRVRKETALEKKLSSKIVPDAVDLVKGEFDIDALELDGNDIKGFDDVFAPIADKRKSLLLTETFRGNEPKPNNPATTQDAALREIMGLK